MKKIKKMKHKKTIIAVIVIAVLVLGFLYAYKKILPRYTTAQVIPVSNAITEYWEDEEMDNTGIITNSDSQTVYLSDPEAVAQVYVTEGQTVAKGDVLLAYDASEIDESIAEKQTDIVQLGNDLAIAESQLKNLRNTKPKDEKAEAQDGKPKVEGPEKNKEAYRYLKKSAKAYQGKGTMEEPYLFLCTDDCYATAGFLNQIMKKEWYCTFEIRSENLKSGELLSSVTLSGKSLSKADGSTFYLVRTGEPYIPETNDQEEEQGFTRAELNKAIREKEATISDLNISIRKGNLELAQLRDSKTDSYVTAKVSGTVSKVGSLDEFEDDGSAFIVVSGSEGLYVKGQVNEWYLEKVEPGQKITGTSWISDTKFEATIKSVNDYPVKNTEYYSSSGNISYYEYLAYIEDASQLENGESVQISMNTGSTSEGIYLEKMFVLQDAGQSYVYVMNEDERLEKRTIEAGKTVWGSYVQVKSGLSEDDYIAFPYGKTAKEGATCKVVDYIE